MYRVIVKPLSEKSPFKPVKSELIVNQENGNISVYNGEKIVSSFKDTYSRMILNNRAYDGLSQYMSQAETLANGLSNLQGTGKLDELLSSAIHMKQVLEYKQKMFGRLKMIMNQTFNKWEDFVINNYVMEAFDDDTYEKFMESKIDMYPEMEGWDDANVASHFNFSSLYNYEYIKNSESDYNKLLGNILREIFVTESSGRYVNKDPNINSTNYAEYQFSSKNGLLYYKYLTLTLKINKLKQYTINFSLNYINCWNKEKSNHVPKAQYDLLVKFIKSIYKYLSTGVDADLISNSDFNKVKSYVEQISGRTDVFSSKGLPATRSDFKTELNNLRKDTNNKKFKIVKATYDIK